MTDISSVIDIPFKIDSLENMGKVHKRYMDELSPKLLVQGLRVINLVIKNIVLINEKKEE